MHCLFAYGSLINQFSRNSTGVFADVYPARVSGIKRGWYVKISEDKDTGLGAIIDDASCCNGVLIVANSKEFIALDNREKIHGYRKIYLSPDQVIFGDSKTTQKIEAICTYVTDEIMLPTKDYPIAQSYLDVVLEGCLSISDNFAKEFIVSTDGWEFPWIDDRRNPRYRRPIIANTTQIDRFLQKFFPELIVKRQIIK